MGSKERRLSPRKECAVPLRFRLANVGMNGESVNLSERGIYFKSQCNINVGEPLQMYFTVPQEFTGRSAGRVRCNARVVRVEAQAAPWLVGVGAVVERFERMPPARDWGS